MKKEDLCMLLLVVALLLVVSKNTKIFEGVDDTLDNPGVDKIVTPGPPPSKLPPTPKKVPPTAVPKKAPPAPKKVPPTAAPKKAPPAPKKAPPAPKKAPPAPKKAPPAPTEKKDSPFGSPLINQDEGAFGQGWVKAWDSNADVYASSSSDEGYGEKIPLSMQQEYLTMKSLGTLTPEIEKNLGEVRSQAGVLGTEFKPWDPSSTSGALLDSQFESVQITREPRKTVSFDTPPSQQDKGVGVGGGKPIEVHMVYGEWCGHSTRAKPAFQELVSDNSITTGSGTPVKFVMTTDDSPGMKQFASQVKGFPSYMVVKSDSSIEELNIPNRTKDGIVSAVKALKY